FPRPTEPGAEPPVARKRGQRRGMALVKRRRRSKYGLLRDQAERWCGQRVSPHPRVGGRAFAARVPPPPPPRRSSAQLELEDGPAAAVELLKISHLVAVAVDVPDDQAGGVDPADVVPPAADVEAAGAAVGLDLPVHVARIEGDF